MNASGHTKDPRPYPSEPESDDGEDGSEFPLNEDGLNPDPPDEDQAEEDD